MTGRLLDFASAKRLAAGSTKAALVAAWRTFTVAYVIAAVIGLGEALEGGTAREGAWRTFWLLLGLYNLLVWLLPMGLRALTRWRAAKPEAPLSAFEQVTQPIDVECCFAGEVVATFRHFTGRTVERAVPVTIAEAEAITAQVSLFQFRGGASPEEGEQVLLRYGILPPEGAILTNIGLRVAEPDGRSET